ncbi:OmpA family protein [Flavobacteriales bacterium]|nr:OmpA family protein [Flavobacteriales bacterium]
MIKIIEKNNSWDKPFLLLSNIYFIENDVFKSSELLLEIYDVSNINDYEGIEKVANNFYKKGFYSEALYYYNAVCKLDTTFCNSKIKRLIKSCKFSINSINNPVVFNPINLGVNINSNMSEIGPAISSDDNKIIFTRRIEDGNSKPQEDFYYSNKINGEWQKALPFPSPLNTAGNEGALSFSSDQSLLIYTACNRSDGFGSCDLYYGYNDINNLNFVNLGQDINSKYWDSQACFSSDRNFIYFVSNRPGGYGGTDIWISAIKKDGFSRPVNAGSEINTEMDEMSPYIHPDNLNLYFASNGHVGLGDYDIFLSKRNDVSDSWNSPVNLGYPINNHLNQNSLVVSSNGVTAYYASTNDGYGLDDIFYFDLPEIFKANKLNQIELEIIQSKAGEEIILKNVLFSTNSYDLISDSLFELDLLAEYIIKYDINILIEGHTDSIGNSNSNLLLSKNRAQSVYDYLVSKSVKNDKISFKGFGDKVPISTNSTELGRSLNRRTSFRVVD